jgi:hypothetical protein
MLFHGRGEAERQADKGDRVTKKEKWRKKLLSFWFVKLKVLFAQSNKF